MISCHDIASGKKCPLEGTFGHNSIQYKEKSIEYHRREVNTKGWKIHDIYDGKEKIVIYVFD
jgi:hypothetical protein